MAAGLSVDLDGWRQEFEELTLRLGGRFARVEPRRRMASFVRGLLAGLPRKNCWTIAVRHEVTWDQWRAHKEVRLMPKVWGPVQCARTVPASACAAGNRGVRSPRNGPRIPVPSRGHRLGKRAQPGAHHRPRGAEDTQPGRI
jgi:hypothetical protein